MGRGRVTSQYAVREARAPKPSREEGDRDREDREKEDRGRDGRRLHKSSDSDPLRPVLVRSDRNHSWKCIAGRGGQGEKYPVKQKEITWCVHITNISLCSTSCRKQHNNKHVRSSRVSV